LEYELEYEYEYEYEYEFEYEFDYEFDYEITGSRLHVESYNGVRFQLAGCANRKREAYTTRLLGWRKDLLEGVCDAKSSDNLVAVEPGRACRWSGRYGQSLGLGR
jgi:hypothetical protein